jgi:hypothetical protein
MTIPYGYAPMTAEEASTAAEAEMTKKYGPLPNRKPPPPMTPRTQAVAAAQAETDAKYGPLKKQMPSSQRHRTK